MTTTRRRLLAGLGGAATFLAGCAESPGGPETTDGADTTDGTATTDGTDTTDGTATTDGTDTTDGTTPTTGAEGTLRATSDPVDGPTVTAESSGTTAGNGTTGSSTTAASGDLDLREANVTAVAVEPADGGSYEFSVTLYHDDDGEDGYANWWQVETLDGEQLGRRELLHAHGTQEFTRSATVEVPAGGCVVVRGHDQTHGYGGQAMVVTVETGATRAVRQGPERQSLRGDPCP
ncbi:hypothetical protein [Halomarina rubra]|uniref:Lipoprotein n=1 Tax=Halomarina rubra TaxID=2071873 RepID=A0ABD6B082_9EURY|nr:hypothetical protein [Halomarina rubra]